MYRPWSDHAQHDLWIMSRTMTGVRISSSGAIWLTSLHLKIQFGSESNIDPIALPPPICFWKS